MTSITRHDDIYGARHYALGILVVVYTSVSYTHLTLPTISDV